MEVTTWHLCQELGVVDMVFVSVAMGHRERDDIVMVSGVRGCRGRDHMVFVSGVRDHGRYIWYFNLHLPLLSPFLYIRT